MFKFKLPLKKRKVKYVPQMEMTECGAASLAMILGYHGHHASLSELRQACGVSRDGANALAIVRAAKSYGLDAKGAKCEINQLAKLPLPAILHWDFNHFLVLEKINKKRAVIVDPACGRRTIRLKELGIHFTGVILLFSPSAQFHKRAAAFPSLKKYVEIFRQSLPAIFQILLASVLLQITGIVFPAANQILLDRVIHPAQDKWLWGLAFGLGGAIIFKALLTLVRSYVLQGLQIRLDTMLMGRFLDHLMHLPLGFFQNRESGDLVQRVHGNAVLRNLLGTQTVSAILDVFLLLSFALLMLAYNYKLGLIVIAFSALRVVALLLLKDRNQQYMSSELASSGREGGALVEALTGLETTKASRAGSRMVQRWAHRMTQRVNNSLQRRKLSITMNQMMVVIQGLTTASVFFIGGREVLQNNMTTGVFAAFLMLQNLFLGPLETMLDSLTQFQYLGTHLQRLDDILDTATEQSGDRDPGRLQGRIEFENVSFSYSPGAPPVIQGATFSIEPGEKIALVGPSGAGKSTLAYLMLGLHKPLQGTIRYDGISLNELDLKKVRNQMGVVLQETFLFDDTVRANLSLNNSEIPLSQLQKAAKTACIDQVIENLPQGYATRIGENGSSLSGGERQRLNLARALAHDPAVLLLDEATSSLDLGTEAKLHANLAGLGCTRIIIAHRIATIRDADRIFVISGGRIVQTGSYDELCAQEGLFSDLVHSGMQKPHPKEPELAYA